MLFHNHSLSIYCEGALLIGANSLPLSVCWGKQHVPGRRNLREVDKVTPTQLEKSRKKCRVGQGHYSALFGNWSLAIKTQVRKLAQRMLFKQPSSQLFKLRDSIALYCKWPRRTLQDTASRFHQLLAVVFGFNPANLPSTASHILGLNRVSRLCILEQRIYRNPQT